MNLFCVDKDGFRRVNDREREALIYTFGTDVGGFLVRIIRIEYDPNLITFGKRGKRGRVVNDREIKMRSEYDPELLRWLGIFIHEAAHIWQRETECHRGGEGGKNYDYLENQLLSLELEREEHASAVQDWFYVNYGIDSGMIDGKRQVDGPWLWQRILPVFGRDPDTDPDAWSDAPKLRTYIGASYDRVITEIRDWRLLNEKCD